MTEVLDVLLECGPIVTGLNIGVGEHTEATIAFTKHLQARDVDVCFDGERVPGVASIHLNGRTVGDIGMLRVRRFSREWAASETPVELSLVARDPDDGHIAVRIPCGRVTLGEPVSVRGPRRWHRCGRSAADAKYLDVPLRNAPAT